MANVMFGTRYVCLYVDQKTQKWSITVDAETLKRLRQSEVVLLRNTAEDEDNLRFSYPQQGVAVNQCTSSGHSCHLPARRNQLFPWMKKDSRCYVDKRSPVASYNGLPAEILRLVFGLLKPNDMKKVLLVSKSWKSVAEHPGLWTGLGLPYKCKMNAQHLLKLSHCSLFSKLQHLGLFGFSFVLVDTHVKLFLNLDLYSIKIGNIDLSQVSEEVLGKLVNSCRECCIEEHYTREPVDNPLYDPVYTLGNKKIGAILAEVQEGTRLKSFKLCHVNNDYGGLEMNEENKLDLSSIPADVVANAFSKFKTLNLENLHLSSEQLMSVFDCGLSNLKSLSIGGIPLDAGQTGQLMELLDKTCQLKYLSLFELDVTNISSKSIARAIIKVETVVLIELKIESYQLEEIFLASITGDSNMKNLSMLSMNNHLYKVSPEVFAKAINKLESVEIDEDLPENLLKEMFKVMSLETKLKNIGMPDNQIGVDVFKHIVEVDPVVLAKALNNLESVKINFGSDGECRLIYPQLAAFFKQFSLKTKLKRILREEHEDFPVKLINGVPCCY